MSFSTKAWTVAYKLMGGLIVILVLGVVVVVSLNSAQLRAENQAMYADMQASLENAESLYEQLLSEGVEPEGDAPSEVVTGPAGETGERGPRGYPGDDGADSVIAGPAGADGVDGAKGDPGVGEVGPQGPQGLQGERGAASTVHGPQGPAGPAGPACPDSSTPTTVWIPVVVEPDGTPETRQAIVCLTNEGETP